MRIDQLSAVDAVASLHNTPQGLSSEEASRRLGEFGPNQVEKLADQPLWLRFLKEFFHFFAVILWLAAGLAFLGEWSAPGQGMAKVGTVVIGVIVVSGFFSFWQEYRAEQTLAALLKLLPQEVKVLRDDKAMSLAVTHIWSLGTSCFFNRVTIFLRTAASSRPLAGSSAWKTRHDPRCRRRSANAEKPVFA